MLSSRCIRQTVSACDLGQANQLACRAEIATQCPAPSHRLVEGAIVESTMKRFSYGPGLRPWGYAKSLYLYGSYLVWRRTGDKRYLEYIKNWIDSHVE